MEKAIDIAETIPPDPSGLDEDAWFAVLEAELAKKPTVAERVERVVWLRAEMAQLAALEARELAALAGTIEEEPAAGADSVGAPAAEDVMAAPPSIQWRSLIAELAAAVRVSDRTMAGRVTEAAMLVGRFPKTLEALQDGLIDRGHAAVIMEAGVIVEDDTARARYEDAVLERATTVTPGRLRRVARLAAERLTEVSFEDRHAKAKQQRAVELIDLGDGMSRLVHTLPTLLAEATWDRLTRQAKAIVTTGDPRTYDQIRSDLMTELLLVGEPSADPDGLHVAAAGIRAEVAIVIPALALLGESDEPATIAGKSPIDLGTAEYLAGNTPSWTRVLTHPVSRQILATDDYRPPRRLRRHLRNRDGRCRFPTCNRSVWRCDIDHTEEWHDGGKTRHDNLAHLCRYHHVLKSHGDWRVTQPSPGVLDWVSPLGRRIRDTPDTTVRFE
jgi:hypothetical protein